MHDLPPARRRSGVRRHYRARCRALHWDRFEELGERLLDLSPTGALLECDAEVRIGDQVLLSFRMPWLGPDVLITAEVARVVAGLRAGDPGRGLGLHFLDVDPEERAELRARLAPFEPAPPARSHPIDYALAVRMVDQRPSPGALILT
jgi:hypothetical protein